GIAKLCAALLPVAEVVADFLRGCAEGFAIFCYELFCGEVGAGHASGDDVIVEPFGSPVSGDLIEIEADQAVLMGELHEPYDLIRPHGRASGGVVAPVWAQ